MCQPLTLSLSPSNKLWVLLSFLALNTHETAESLIVVNNSHQLFHLGIVLLEVLICLLLQNYHLGLSIITITKGQLSKINLRKIAVIFLSFSLNMCFGCSKDPSHRDSSFEYPQHMIWLRNKKNNFQLCTLIWGPAVTTRHILFPKIIILIYIIPAPLLLHEIREQKSVGCMALSTVGADQQKFGA